MTERVAVLGAGVSGLTIARLLSAAGKDVTVYEREPTVGGAARSVHVDGFTYDVTGVHVIYSKDAPVLDLMQRLLQMETIRTRRRTKIFYRGTYIKYPFENGLGELPPEDRFLCLKGYVEAHYRRKYEAAPAPESFLDWIYWRFGEGIAECFMVPYNQRLWKTDLASLSSGWVAGRVPDAPLDDVVKAALGISTEGYVHQATFFYPRRGGFQAIADAMAAPVADRILLSTPVQRVERLARGFAVNGEAYDTVVNTIPLPCLVAAYDSVPEEVHEAAGDLRFVSMATFLIGLKGEDPTDHSWVYLPHPENGRVHRVTHLSNYSPEMAPPGMSCLLAEMTYRGEHRVDEREALAVVDELHDCGILNRNAVQTLHWSQAEHAYIIQDLGFTKNRSTVLSYFRDEGLHTLGRFGRCEYLNVDMCLRAAIDLAGGLLGRVVDPAELA